MGFRNLHAFNLAMFLTMQDSIVSHIFKAKYFPNRNFLDANLGHNPSFIWRSIHASQVIVKNNMRLNIPPKIKYFIWRVLRGCLPFRQRLQCKGVQCLITCFFFLQHWKWMAHFILFGCNQAKSIWQAAGIWQFIEHKVKVAEGVKRAHFLLAWIFPWRSWQQICLRMTRFGMSILILLTFQFQFPCSILHNGNMQGNLFIITNAQIFLLLLWFINILDNWQTPPKKAQTHFHSGLPNWTEEEASSNHLV